MLVHTSPSDLQTTTGIDEVFRLPIVTREDSTQLQNVLCVYKDPSPLTQFSYDKRDTLTTSHAPRIGFVFPSNPPVHCACSDYNQYGDFLLLSQIYILVCNQLCHGIQVHNDDGLFLVPRKRIWEKAR